MIPVFLLLCALFPFLCTNICNYFDLKSKERKNYGKKKQKKKREKDIQRHTIWPAAIVKFIPPEMIKETIYEPAHADFIGEKNDAGLSKLKTFDNWLSAQ